MEYITTNDFKIAKPTAVVLGNFDGIHLGHKSLIDKAFDEKKILTPTVLSFHPHPVNVLNRNTNLKLITVREEKAFLLEKLGIEIYIEYPFDNEFASLNADDFVEDILFTQINCKTIIVGENYRFGKNRQGDVDLLRQIAPKYNAKVIVVPILSKDDYVISSTLIRQYISGGFDIKEATKRLTFPYMTMGKAKETETSQYTTLCFSPCPLKLLPKDGVYLTKTYTDFLYESITTISSPTLNNKESKIVTTYLPKLESQIFDKEIIIYYYDYIGERKVSKTEQYAKYMKLHEIHTNF